LLPSSIGKQIHIEDR